MGLVDELRGLRVCIDTAPIIYFIEKNQRYGAKKFITNDPDLKKVSDIDVLVLDDFLDT